MTFDALISVLMTERPKGLIAVAGPPGSGKTSLSNKLAEAMGPGVQALPMDGFHLDNATLEAQGLLHRKGAPETFDAQGFLDAVTALSEGKLETWPGFDREADSVVPDAIVLAPTATTFLIEGNYLLLNQPVWRDLRRFWDQAIWLDVNETVLRRRLVQRWLDHGLSSEAARARVEDNDMVNARLIVAQSDLEDAVIFANA